MAVSVMLLLAIACRSGKPEDEIRAAFDTSKAEVERGDAVRATEVLAPNFKGPEGLDRAGARMLLAGLFRQGKVGVTVLQEDVKVDGDRGEQVVELVLTQRSGGVVPEELSRKTYRLRWRRKGRDWWLEEMEPLS